MTADEGPRAEAGERFDNPALIATLRSFKVPATVHVVAEMPTTTGTNGTKIKAGTLREWATEGVPDASGPI